jgi:pimeloyl-ACP methyl ester carboxylesterase
MENQKMAKTIKLFRNDKKQKEYFKVYDKALAQLPISYETEYIKTAYGNTHVIRCGEKENPKLVLLHCMGFSSISWYKNLELLSKHFEVFCIDSIGEPGKTESNRKKIKNEDYLQWLIEVLDALKLERPNLAGWSFGGFLATTFVMNFPERVKRLVIMSPAATIAPLTPIFYLKLFPALFTASDKKINQFLKWISGNDNIDFPNPAFAVFTSGMKSFQGWAMGTKLVIYSESDFKKIKAPSLLLIGEQDPIYKKISPRELADKFNTIQPNIKAETVHGKHGFPIQQAQYVNERLISFLLTT